MKKRTNKIFASSVLFLAGLLGLCAIGNQNKQSKAAIDYVASYYTNAYSESFWGEDGATSYEMVASNLGVTGSIKFAVSNEYLYYRVEIYDETGEGNDNPYTKVSFGDEFFELDGKYYDNDNDIQNLPSLPDRAWAREISKSTNWGSPRESLGLSYNLDTHVYTMTEKFWLGPNAIEKAVFHFSYKHYNANGAAWNPSQPDMCYFDGDVSIGSAPESGPEGGEGNYIIPVKTGTFLPSASFDDVPYYQLETQKGEGSSGQVKLVVFGTIIYFRLEVEDATKTTGDTPVYSITYNGKTNSMDTGRYLEGPGGTNDLYEAEAPSWCRIVSRDFGDFIYSSVKYTEGKYIYICGFQLGEMGNGVKPIHVSFGHGNDPVWKLNLSDYDNYLFFEHDMYIPQTDNNIIAGVNGDQSGLITEDEWGLVTSHPLTGANEGFVKLANVGSTLFLRLEVKDDTNISGKDFIGYTVSVGGKTESKQGNFDPWLTTWDGHTGDFGIALQNFSYNSETGSYVFVRGFSLEDKFNVGGIASIKVVFKDAGASGDWGSGEASEYSCSLPMVQFSVAIPTVTYSVNGGSPITIEDGATIDLTYDDTKTYTISASDAGKGASKSVSSNVTESFSNQGTYVITYSLDNTDFAWSDGTTNDKVYTIKINKIIVTKPTVSYTTNGDNPVSLANGVAVNVEAGNTYGFVASNAPKGVTKTYSEGADGSITDLGLYSVIYSLDDKVNYVWDDGTSDDLVFSIKLGVKEVAIPEVKYQINDNDPVAFESNLVNLDVAPDQVIKFIAPEVEGTNIVYSDGSENGFSSEGTYSVTYKLADNKHVWPNDSTSDITYTISLVDYTVVDIAKMPNENDWSNAKAYNLDPVTVGSTGATGTIKFYTAADNFFMRVDVDDPTATIGDDAIEFRMAVYNDEGEEVVLYHAQGNYDMWMSPIENQKVGSPSLLEDRTTNPSNPRSRTPGTLSHLHGFYINQIEGVDYYKPGAKIHITFTHFDSQSASETWDGHNSYAHIIKFDHVLTFGEEADLTVRPVDPTDGFDAESKDVINTKATICWSEFDNADSYKLYVYEVNEAGAAEPYNHLGIEGPIYSGDGTYAELIAGLTQGHRYAIQVMAYDIQGNLIGASNLIIFTTMTNAEYNEWLESQKESSSEDSSIVEESSEIVVSSTGESIISSNPASSQEGTSSSSEDKPSGGCGGSILAASGLISMLAIGGLFLVNKKRK